METSSPQATLTSSLNFRSVSVGSWGSVVPGGFDTASEVMFVGDGQDTRGAGGHTCYPRSHRLCPSEWPKAKSDLGCGWGGNIIWTGQSPVLQELIGGNWGSRGPWSGKGPRVWLLLGGCALEVGRRGPS